MLPGLNANEIVAAVDSCELIPTIVGGQGHCVPLRNSASEKQFYTISWDELSS